MSEKTEKTSTCPLCGRVYSGAPAVSRSDNLTLICPDCGTRQALADMGVNPDEQERILDIIHRCRPQ